MARRKPGFGHRAGQRARRPPPFPRREHSADVRPLYRPHSSLSSSAEAMLRLVSSASTPSSAGVLAKVAASPASTRPGASCSPSPRPVFPPLTWALRTGRRTFASSSARQADITLTVDGKEVTVPQGASPNTHVYRSEVPIRPFQAPLSFKLVRLRAQQYQGVLFFAVVCGLSDVDVGPRFCYHDRLAIAGNCR